MYLCSAVIVFFHIIAITFFSNSSSCYIYVNIASLHSKTAWIPHVYFVFLFHHPLIGHAYTQREREREREREIINAPGQCVQGQRMTGRGGGLVR